MRAFRDGLGSGGGGQESQGKTLMKTLNFEDARKAWKGFKKEEEIGSIYYCCLVRGPSHEAVTYTVKLSTHATLKR